MSAVTVIGAAKSRAESDFSSVLGVVAQIRFGDEFSLSHLSSSYGFDLGPAEGR
ncbi:hypothetical protein GGQ68_003425, partial [Sagittula marina]|nr:hypothetical protein [Sagittula marina]